MFVFALFGKDVNAKESSHTADAICYSSSDQSEYDSEADIYFGWLWKDSKWYYYEEADMEYPGEMVKDCIMTIGDADYLFDANGCMLTGWQKRPEGWYYIDSSGQIKKRMAVC